MSRWKKIIGSAVIITVVGGVGFAYHFQNEIQAVLLHFKYSQEEQIALEQENEAKLEDALAKANLSTEAVKKAQEETAKNSETKIEETQNTNQKVTTKPVTQPKAPAKTELPKESDTEQKLPAEEEEKEPAEQEYDAKLAGMVGEIYALRTSFVGQLDGLLEQAKNEYIAMTEEERETNKTAFVGKYIRIAGQLEASCDAQMQEILHRIEAHLREQNGDLSLIAEIETVYENEKALKKSYYLSLLE